jgi:hypothetical protein
MVWTELFDTHQTASPTINGNRTTQILPLKATDHNATHGKHPIRSLPNDLTTSSAFQVLGLGHIQGQEYQSI